MVAVTTTGSSCLGSFIEKSVSEKVIESCDRGGKCVTKLTLLKYLFLEELDEPPPAKTSAIVLTVPNCKRVPDSLTVSVWGWLTPTVLSRISTMLTDPEAILGSCCAVPSAASALGSLVLFSSGQPLPRPSPLAPWKLPLCPPRAPKSLGPSLCGWLLWTKGQGFRLDELFNKITHLSALFDTVSDILVIVAFESKVCPWLRSSRAKKTNEL